MPAAAPNAENHIRTIVLASVLPCSVAGMIFIIWLLRCRLISNQRHEQRTSEEPITAHIWPFPQGGPTLRLSTQSPAFKERASRGTHRTTIAHLNELSPRENTALSVVEISGGIHAEGPPGLQSEEQSIPRTPDGPGYNDSPPTYHTLSTSG
ncbi:hypothetical protein EIP86_002388 [Pleurotus ostreatoroseus]|nr:hypothetical protein EIP86_002388 [Pleurotus ostreatoroseus]